MTMIVDEMRELRETGVRVVGFQNSEQFLNSLAATRM